MFTFLRQINYYNKTKNIYKQCTLVKNLFGLYYFVWKYKQKSCQKVWPYWLMSNYILACECSLQINVDHQVVGSTSATTVATRWQVVPVQQLWPPGGR